MNPSAIAFIKQLLDDETYRESFSSLENISSEAALAKAKADGFDFTAEELREVIAQLEPKLAQAANLSEADLENVVGGFGDTLGIIGIPFKPENYAVGVKVFDLLSQVICPTVTSKLSNNFGAQS